MSFAMSWRDHYIATLILSLPLVVGQVAMIGVWTADIVMLGWISTDALAAGTQANRLYQPFYFIALGLTLAVSPLTAQALGAGSRRQARRVMRQGLWLAVVYGVITLIPLWFGRDLLLALGQDAELAENAGPFLRMLAPGLIPTYIYFVLRNYVSAHKRPMPPVIVNLCGVVINIILNKVLSEGLFGLPAMGLAGIGLATSITFTSMALMLAIYMNLRPPFRFTRPFARLNRMDWSITRRLLIIGFPISMTLLAETGMFIVAGLYIGLFGTVAVAASGIANQIAAVSFMVPLAISQAATIRVGHEAGAGKRVDLMRAGIAAVVLTLLICLVLTLLLAVFSKAFIGVFLNTDDPAFLAVLTLGVPMVMITALFQLADGLQVVFTSILRGINDTRVPAILSIICYFGVGGSCGYMLATPLGMGPIGVWWGLLLGLTSGAVLLGGRCLLIRQRIRNGHRLVML